MQRIYAPTFVTAAAAGQWRHQPDHLGSKHGYCCWLTVARITILELFTETVVLDTAHKTEFPSRIDALAAVPRGVELALK